MFKHIPIAEMRCDRHGLARTQRSVHVDYWQRHAESADAFQDPGAGVPLNNNRFASSNGGRLSKTVAGAIRPAQVSKPDLNPQFDKESDMKTKMNLSYQSPVQDHRHAGSTAQGAATATNSTRYTCTMHPEIIRDAPGSCPKCGMTLVPLRE